MSVRFLCPWDFPGKNTGVGCHFLLRGSSQPRDWTALAGEFFTSEQLGKPNSTPSVLDQRMETNHKVGQGSVHQYRSVRGITDQNCPTLFKHLSNHLYELQMVNNRRSKQGRWKWQATTNWKDLGKVKREKRHKSICLTSLPGSFLLESTLAE